MLRKTTQHYTLTVPTLNNDGVPVHYVEVVRENLLDQDILSWTETPGQGMWGGQAEPVVVFHFYSGQMGLYIDLGRIGRQSMPDQQVVMVTWHGPVDIWEA